MIIKNLKSNKIKDQEVEKLIIKRDINFDLQKKEMTSNVSIPLYDTTLDDYMNRYQNGLAIINPAGQYAKCRQCSFRSTFTSTQSDLDQPSHPRSLIWINLHIHAV